MWQRAHRSRHPDDLSVGGSHARAPIEEKTYPKLYAWARRMQARACYKTAGEKASEASGEEYVPISDIKM